MMISYGRYLRIHTGGKCVGGKSKGSIKTSNSNKSRNSNKKIV